MYLFLASFVVLVTVGSPLCWYSRAYKLSDDRTLSIMKLKSSICFVKLMHLVPSVIPLHCAIQGDVNVESVFFVNHMKIITDFRVICNENVSTSERGNDQVKTCSLNLFSARRFPAFKPHFEILDGYFFLNV